MRDYQVISNTGRVVTLTRERCEALEPNGARCKVVDFRGVDRVVLCWLHRQIAMTGRPLEIALPVCPEFVAAE